MGQGLVHGELEETLLAAFQFVENPGRWGSVRVVHFFLLAGQGVAIVVAAMGAVEQFGDGLHLLQFFCRPVFQ